MAGLEVFSSADKVSLTRAVVQKLGELGKKAKRAGMVLDVPKDLFREFKLFNGMVKRYKQTSCGRARVKIFTHTADEAQAEQVICRWVIDETNRIAAMIRKRQ